MSYIGVQPVTRATRVRTFGALASATTTIAIPGGFSPSNIEVFIDGLYVQPTDYDDSDGFNLVFITTLALGTEYVVMEARNFEVANHYTKQEIQNAAFDFNTMPTVGGDPVVESGSNADGEYTKFADGTQVSIGTVQIPDNNNGGTSFNLASAFINASYSLTANPDGVASSGLNASRIAESEVLTVSSIGLKILVHTAGTVLNTANLFCGYIAIGRWK
jgi:hypothetical protein